MKTRYSFEFMDQTWVPLSLRRVLQELVECVCSPPFRTYNRWVANEVLGAALGGACDSIVELGAGTAPITRLLARQASPKPIRLIPCDDNPEVRLYRDLERRHPGIVTPLYAPTDFSKPHQWGPATLLFLSNTFHHLPPSARSPVIASLTKSGARVLVFEALRKTAPSMVFASLSVIPALLLPLWFFTRPGKPWRFVWCWLIPLAPLLFWWDSLISCLRQWKDEEWRLELEKHLPSGRTAIVKSWLFAQMVAW